MTILDCSVESCAYNKERSCRKENILVEGDEAKVTSETCCQSFEPRGCGCENKACACGEPEKETDVSCKAECCVHNRGEKCSADHIGIAGGHADRAVETECATFKCR